MKIKCVECDSDHLCKLRLDPTVLRCFNCKHQFLEDDAIVKFSETLEKDKNNKVVVEKKSNKRGK